MVRAFRPVYCFNSLKVNHGTCAMERVVQAGHEKNQMMIGRALCRAYWQAGQLTGSLANWCGVFLICSWKGERHKGEENVPARVKTRGGARCTELGASDSLCCCLGILNKHTHTLTASPTFFSSRQAVKAHSGRLRQPNSGGAPFFFLNMSAIFYLKCG